MITFSRHARFWFGCSVSTVLALTAGCGQSLPKNETTYPVHGVVKIDGEPIKGGKIRFTRTDGKSLDGQAKINAEGEYAAFYYARQEGLVPGEYKLWLEDYAGEPSEGIPEKYKKADSSDKTVTVGAEDNSIDVDFETDADAE